MLAANSILTQRIQDKPSTYHNYECCEWTRGIDTLLSRYRRDREEVLSLIENNPDKLIEIIWTQDGPVAIDNSCGCQMGKGEIRSPFSCAQCKNLRRLIDFRFKVIDQPFQIECGQYAGKKLVVSSREVLEQILSWDKRATRRVKCYIQQYKEQCDNIRSMSGDSFTIGSLVNWIIMDYFQTKDLLPHVVNLHTAFICSGVGYSLFDVPSIGTINNLDMVYYKAEIVKSIIYQLLVILTELSQVNFSHGNPTGKALVFDKQPISYMYNNVHIKGPITLQLTDFYNSSISHNGIQFFPTNFKLSMCMEKNDFKPEINQNYYRLTNSTIENYTSACQIGLPLYKASFDFYCLMLSLMSNKSFYKVVVEDPDLNKIWSSMWLKEDLPNEIILNNTPIDFIKGKWLRCDLITHLWKIIT